MAVQASLVLTLLTPFAFRPTTHEERACRTLTSTEGADVVYVLTAHAALALLLKRLFLEDVGLSLAPLHIHTKRHTLLAEEEAPLAFVPQSQKQCKHPSLTCILIFLLNLVYWPSLWFIP